MASVPAISVESMNGMVKLIRTVFGDRIIVATSPELVSRISVRYGVGTLVVRDFMVGAGRQLIWRTITTVIAIDAPSFWGGTMINI